MTRNMIYHNDNGNLMYDVKESDWKLFRKGLKPIFSLIK